MVVEFQAMAATHADFMVLEMDQGHKPCLVDNSTEEEFYNTPSPTSSPSEDIWKKFELFPTPPLSPIHSASGSPPSSPPPLISRGPSTPERLQRVSECLLEEDAHWLSQPISYPVATVIPTSQSSTSSLKSNLIQDCMWSGLAAEERKKLLKIEKKTNSDSEKKLVRCSSPPPLVPVSSDYSVTSDCVDPAAVFPYPLSETKLDIYSSGACTPSDSEEEIDVVTVADKTLIIQQQPQSQTTTKLQPTIQRHHHLGRPRVITVVGSKRSRGTAAAVMTIPLKRLKTDANLEEVKRMLQSAIDKPRNFSSRGSSKASSRGSSRGSSRVSSRPSSHPSSDSEDSDKRATHNVLERKRRDDLRCSFNSLRDEVPDLQAKDRAAKVVILKTATDYLHKMRNDEKRLLKEKENERRRHEHLLTRLHALQRL
ncbi:myc protein-like [Amphiura filiformis]|uniref:myc protein-like n=1 Tax=Amphiura filiformis TaxID=82378 RepID=UPI003B218EAA